MRLFDPITLSIGILFVISFTAFLLHAALP